MVLAMEIEDSAIRQAFASFNLNVEDNAISTCASICSEYNLSYDDFVAKWDAFSMNNNVNGAADIEKLTIFRSKLAHESTIKGKDTSAPSTQRRKLRPSGNPAVKREIKTETSNKLNDLYSMKSPEGKHSRLFASPPGRSNKSQKSNHGASPGSLESPPSSKYENRTDAGKVVADFNAHLKMQSLGINDMDQDIKFHMPYPERNQKPNISYMYTPLFQRALALDSQLTAYEKLIKEHYQLESIAAIGDPSPAVVTVVGRIICEAAEGKLNANVLQLEGSRKSCGGQRVPLDLSGVSNYEVFPGKIVALEGILADVRAPMVVKKFLSSIPAPMPMLSKSISNDERQPLRVFASSGPYTTSNNIDFLPLNDLLQNVIDQKPDVLILLGPFIDSQHSVFQDGCVRHDGMLLSFEDVFLFKIMTLLDNVLAQHDKLQVIIVPSLRDAHHDFVFPQPPFDKKKACEAFGSPEYAKRVHMVSNPCTFALNNIVFGVSTLDILVQLSSNELHKSNQREPSRLLRLSEQIINQRSYYPMFPPPPSSDAPLDLLYMKQYQLESTPDILILPSILNRFCGRVQDSVCLNPGQLCKGDSGGTFASITVFPVSNSSNDLNDTKKYLAPDRTMVELKRI